MGFAEDKTKALSVESINYCHICKHDGERRLYTEQGHQAGERCLAEGQSGVIVSLHRTRNLCSGRKN